MFDAGLGNTNVKAKVTEVLRAVARVSDVSVDDLRGPRRKREFARPRQIAMYLCRELTGQSYPCIGNLIGQRDHTTILFAWRKVSAMRASVPGLDDLLSSLTASIMVEAIARSEREAKARMDVPVSSLTYPKSYFADKSGRTHWTMAQIKELKELRAKGLSRAQIAYRMNRTVCAIAHKVAELKLRRLSGRHTKDATEWMEQAA